MNMRDTQIMINFSKNLKFINSLQDVKLEKHCLFIDKYEYFIVKTTSKILHDGGIFDSYIVSKTKYKTNEFKFSKRNISPVKITNTDFSNSYYAMYEFYSPQERPEYYL